MTRRTRAVTLACGLLAVLSPSRPTLDAPPGQGLNFSAMDTSVKPNDDC